MLTLRCICVLQARRRLTSATTRPSPPGSLTLGGARAGFETDARMRNGTGRASDTDAEIGAWNPLPHFFRI